VTGVWCEGGGEGSWIGVRDSSVLLGAGARDATNCANRWTNTNFLTFHAIQILIVIVKKLM
jgi:hypothetical protein